MHGIDKRRGCFRGDVMKLENIRKILFITLSNIGDAILTLPVLSALKDNFPNAELDVAVGPRPKDIFTKDPRVRNIYIYDKHTGFGEKLDFIKRLKREKYDLVVDMKTSMVPFLIGSRYRSSSISINRGSVRHKKLIHMNRLKSLGIKYNGRKNIYVDAKDRETVNRLLEDTGFKDGDILTGVNPACLSHLKEWRVEGFIEVIKELLKDGKRKVVLMGEASQQNRVSRKIVDAIRDGNLIDFTGKTNLGELFALIERMRVLLTCDNASMHIASDLGVKVIALFGPTDSEEYGPTGKDDVVIKKNIKCAPCKKARCRFNRECMNEITAEEVLKFTL